MRYTHLSEHERYIISHMHMTGFKPAQIARHLGRDRGTIGRELRRNTNEFGDYHYIPAQRFSDERRTAASQRYKLDQETPLSRTVREGLRQRWSPEQIVGRLQRTHGRDRSMRISHEAIYQWLYRRSRLGECWYEQLRRRRPRRRARCVGQRGQGAETVSGTVSLRGLKRCRLPIRLMRAVSSRWFCGVVCVLAVVVGDVGQAAFTVRGDGGRLIETDEGWDEPSVRGRGFGSRCTEGRWVVARGGVPRCHRGLYILVCFAAQSQSDLRASASWRPPRLMRFGGSGSRNGAW